MEWSGLGKQAYSTAFDDLVNQGYLIQDKKQKNKYSFFDKAQPIDKEERPKDEVIIEYTKEGFTF